MIWNKVGFVLASRQRVEVFLLLKEYKSVKRLSKRLNRLLLIA